MGHALSIPKSRPRYVHPGMSTAFMMVVFSKPFTRSYGCQYGCLQRYKMSKPPCLMPISMAYPPRKCKQFREAHSVLFVCHVGITACREHSERCHTRTGERPFVCAPRRQSIPPPRAFSRFIARSDVVILDAPLLFETKVFCYLIKFSVVVYVKPQIQLQRLMARNGYSSPEAQQRINSQMPLDDKVRQARYVIDNSGEKDELRCQVDTLYAKFRESWPTGTHTLIFCFTSLAVIVGIRPLLTTIFAPRV